jgi:hypothetical protein
MTGYAIGDERLHGQRPGVDRQARRKARRVQRRLLRALVSALRALSISAPGPWPATLPAGEETAYGARERINNGNADAPLRGGSGIGGGQ